MSDDSEGKIRNCRIAVDEEMNALVDYSKVLFNDRGKFKQNDLLHYVNELQNALRDYENAIDEFMTN